MKSIFPLLVVCILVLGGLGAVAVPFEKESPDLNELRFESEKSEARHTDFIPPGQVVVLVLGGFGITARIKSTHRIDNTGEIYIYVGGALNHNEYYLKLPEPIPEGGAVFVSTGLSPLILGLGPCVLTINVYLYHDSYPPEGQETRRALIIGPFILMIPLRIVV